MPLGSRPFARVAITAVPTPIAHSTSFFFAPLASLSLPVIPAWNFSQMRGTPKKTVG